MKTKEQVSLQYSKKVCGYDIKKMPIGAYLVAMEKIKNLPTDVMRICFPDDDPADMIERLSTIDERGVIELASKLLIELPSYMLELIADLTGISLDALETDESIGLTGLVDIVTAFVEVNRLGELSEKVSGLVKELKGKLMLTSPIGSKG
jgi:hypothetical protein